MSVTGFISSLFAGGVGDVVEKVGDAIHKNVTSDKERMALDNEAAKAAQDFNIKLAQMDTDLALGQDKIQEIEAASTNWFIAGARPAAMWVCVLVLFMVYVPKAAVLTAFWAYGVYLAQTGQAATLPALPPFPELGAGEVMGLMSAMLGLGGLRTFEKVKGVAGQH